MTIYTYHIFRHLPRSTNYYFICILASQNTQASFMKIHNGTVTSPLSTTIDNVQENRHLCQNSKYNIILLISWRYKYKHYTQSCFTIDEQKIHPQHHLEFGLTALLKLLKSSGLWEESTKEDKQNKEIEGWRNIKKIEGKRGKKKKVRKKKLQHFFFFFRKKKKKRRKKGKGNLKKEKVSSGSLLRKQKFNNIIISYKEDVSYWVHYFNSALYLWSMSYQSKKVNSR